MASLDLIAATVQQLLSQTTALLQQDVPVVVNDETLEPLERDVRRAMRQLRRCRNEFIATPINRLPPELLRMIFGHLRKPPSTRCFQYPTHVRFSSYEPLTSIMLVCHKWCAVASQAALLWTDIDASTVNVLLSRSLGAPICVSGFLSTEVHWLEATIKDNGARIRELDICVEIERDHIPVLQTILAVDMPRLYTLYLFADPFNSDMQPSMFFTNAPASFPALKALMMDDVFFVPSTRQGHALPQLTHLHLGELNEVSVSGILDLLRHTPALQVLHIGPCGPLIASSPPPSSPVALPSLHEMYIRNLPVVSLEVHDLMRQLEVPSLKFFHLGSVVLSSGTFASKLAPSALTTWMVNRMALTVRSLQFHAVSYGPNVSLNMDIHMTTNVEHEERLARLNTLFNYLPAMLPLSAVEELHLQASQWGAAPASENLLAHLAAHMPAVSTLIVKHDTLRDDLDTDGVIGLGRTVAALLMRNHPVLFPALARLELIVSDIPLALCTALAPALAQRAQDGRRVRTLRIHMDTEHVFRWRVNWLRELPALAAYAETGVFHHVEVGEIYPKLRANMSHVDYTYGEDDAGRLGWGTWRNCVERAKHDYWEE